MLKLERILDAGLSKLIGETRQHISMLEVIDVKVDENILVQVLERCLPFILRKKWDKRVSDNIPQL